MRLIRPALIAAMLLGIAPQALADTIEGTIVAYDRKAQVIVLKDNSIYSLRKFDAPILAELKAGDKVKIETAGEGEDGYGLVKEIAIQN